MNDDARTGLLDAVWEALGTVHLPGMSSSLTELGCVTAVFTNGRDMRMLLLVPANLYRHQPGHDPLLSDLDTALRDVLPPADIQYEVKHYQSEFELRKGFLRAARPEFHQEISDPGSGVSQHDTCVSRALPELLGQGWELDDFALAPKVSAPDGIRVRERVRVLAQARIASEGNDRARLRQDPLGAA